MSHGITTDAWVRVDGGCQIACEVVADEAQFRFGSVRSDGLDLIISEQALANLLKQCEEALRQMRAELDE